MKSKPSAVLLLFIIFHSFPSHAQPTVPPGSGCLLSNNTFLTNSVGVATKGADYRYIYSPSPAYNRVCTQGSAQYVNLTSAVNAPFYNINCGTSTDYDSNNTGVMYYYNVVMCPIDDISWLLMMPLAFFAYRFLTNIKI